MNFDTYVAKYILLRSYVMFCTVSCAIRMAAQAPSRPIVRAVPAALHSQKPHCRWYGVIPKQRL